MRQYASVLLMLAAGVADAQESWVGKTIITKNYGVKIGQYDAWGKLAYIAELNDSIEYTVKGDVGGKLKVVTRDGIVGLMEKRQAVLFTNAHAHFTDALQRDPKDAGAFQKRGYALEQLGLHELALKDYDETIRLRPQDRGGWYSRGNLLSTHKEYDKAIADFTQALRIDPTLTLAFNNRGITWIAKKEYDKAIADFDAAVRIDPKLAYAYNNRGLAWFLKKEYDKALQDFNVSEALDAQNGHVYVNRARLLATSANVDVRDGKKAVQLMDKAQKLTATPDADFYQTLAAAHAEAGNFAHAQRWQRKAMEDAGIKNDADAKRRLELYGEKKAYRQE